LKFLHREVPLVRLGNTELQQANQASHRHNWSRHIFSYAYSHRALPPLLLQQSFFCQPHTVIQLSSFLLSVPTVILLPLTALHCLQPPTRSYPSSFSCCSSCSCSPIPIPSLIPIPLLQLLFPLPFPAPISLPHLLLFSLAVCACSDVLVLSLVIYGTI
jgi:hypothetical protein